MTPRFSWIAWILIILLGFTAPAQAMNAMAFTGVAKPCTLYCENHSGSYPINAVDPSGLACQEIVFHFDPNELRDVQELLGHQEANTTGIYTHLTPVDLVKMHERCHPRNHSSMPDFHAGTEGDSQEPNPSQ